MLTKEEFFSRLEGEEGCDFKEDSKGELTWKCARNTMADSSRL